MTVHRHAKGIGRWVTGFIAVLVVGLLGSTALGAFAHAAGTGGGGNPVTTAVDCGPTDRYNRGLNEAMQAVARKAENQYPDTFGQLSLPPETGNPEAGIFLSFSEDAEGKVAELAEDFVCPDLLIAVSINYSAKEVLGFQDRIHRDRNKARRGQAPLGHATNGSWGIGADINNAAIDVGVPLITKRIKAAFRAEYSARNVRIKITKSWYPYPFPNDGYKGMTILLFPAGYMRDNVETGEMWETRLKKVNLNLRQTRERFRRARVKGSRRQVRKLKRRIIKQRRYKQRLRRKMLGLPWPIQRAS